MNNDTVATNPENNGSSMGEADAKALLADFDPSYSVDSTDYISSNQEQMFLDILQNPSKIDGLTEFEARAFREEGNRLFCKGAYDYMLPNSPFNHKGIKIGGEGLNGGFSDKEALRQMAQDITWINAAQRGVGDLQKLLNSGYAAKLGMSAEDYGGMSVRDKAKKITDSNAITDKAGLEIDFSTWWNSWDVTTKSMTEKKDDGYAISTHGMGIPSITRRQVTVLTEDARKAMRGVYDYSIQDVVPRSPEGRYLFSAERDDANGTVIYDGEMYRLVMNDGEGNKLIDPYYERVDEPSIRLDATVRGRDVGLYDYYKFSKYSKDNSVHTDAVAHAMRKLGITDENEFGRKVWMSSGRVLTLDGDRFYARRLGDKFELEVADGGWTENCHKVVARFQDQFDNERNAMNAIVAREMLNANPELLKMYQEYRASAEDNLFGSLDKRGDWEGVFEKFMERFKDYAKNDSELTPEQINVKNKMMTTYQQFIDLLGLIDKREGFHYTDNGFLDTLAGTGNVTLSGIDSIYKIFSDAYAGYSEMFSSDESFYERYYNWAKEDIRLATSSERFDKGTLVGMVGEEAAHLLAFSSIMRAGTVATALKTLGSSVNTAGRGMKAVGMVKAGQKVKSFGQKVADAGKFIGGGTKAVGAGGEAYGFKRIPEPKFSGDAAAMKKNGVFFVESKVGGKTVKTFFQREKIKKVRVGNFMQEHNAKVARMKSSLEKAIAERKAVAAGQMGQVSADADAMGKVYDDIASLERDIAKVVGTTTYGEASKWVLDIANEMPAVLTLAMSTKGAHTAMSSYKIGEGFVERDEHTGIAKKVDFDGDQLDAAEEYSYYDAAGNAVFFLHINKLMRGILDGKAGSTRLQTSMRNWYNTTLEAASRGDYNRAAAFVALYENAFRRMFATSAKGFVDGVAMHGLSELTHNAESIAVKKARDPEYVPTVEDYLLAPEQAIDALKTGLRMSSGMTALHGTTGSAREIISGRLRDNARLVSRMKNFSDSSRDLWAIAAGMAHVKGKSFLKVENLSPNLDVATKQVREQLLKDADAYERVSADTSDFISKVIDNEVNGGGNSKAIRDEMASKYGESYARILDSIMDLVRTNPKYLEEYAVKYAVKNRMDREAVVPEGRRVDYDVKAVSEGIEKLLGVKVRRPQVRDDGSFMLNIDAGGKSGWLNLVFKKGDIEAKIGEGLFDKGFTDDIILGLTGGNTSFTDELYGALKEEYAALSDAEKSVIATGKDVNGILQRTYDIVVKEGGINGVFDVNAEVMGKNGKPERRKLVTMNRHNNGLTIEDFAHETVHGFVSTLRDMGLLTAEAEQTLRDFYKMEGTAWEEPFVRDLLESRQSLLDALAVRDAVDNLKEKGVLSKLAEGIKQIIKLPSSFKTPKPKRSAVEDFIDKKIEEAKTVLEEMKIDEASKNIKTELDAELNGTKETDAEGDVVETKTTESATTSLVVSNLPIPNSVMMNGVAEGDVAKRTMELNRSGFYYDSHHDVWVNEHSAPSLYHRAVNEAVAKKVLTHQERVEEAWKMYHELMGEAADFAKDGKLDALLERRAKLQKIHELISIDDFTEAERKHLGIVINAKGEPVGVLNSVDGFINEGTGIRLATELREGETVVPYEHDMYGRWAVSGSKKLSAAHNCSSSALIGLLKEQHNTGLSFAMFPSEKGHSRFGALSVLVGRSSIDPKEKYKKTPEGRKQANYLYKKNVGTPDHMQFEQVKSGGNAHEKAVEAVNQFEQFIFKGADADFELNEDVRGAKYLRATNIEMARQEGDKAIYSTSRKPHQFDLFADEKYVDIENLEGVCDYWEAKLGRAFGVNEIKAVVIPKFTEQQMSKVSGIKTTELDEQAIRMKAEDMGIDPEMALARAKQVFATNPEFVKQFLRESAGGSNKFFTELAEIEQLCKKFGIPVYHYEVKNDSIIDICVQTFGQMSGAALDSKAQIEAQQKATSEVEGTRFGVVGSKGAYRYFSGSYNKVMDEINSVIKEAIESVDEGTRAGLKSSKNAELNAWLKENGKDRFGPFILHVGGTDGDQMPRLEYAYKKPKVPQAFEERAAGEELFRLYDFLGNPVRQDEVFAKAYPELMQTPIYLTGTAKFKRDNVKEPAWLDDGTYAIANEDGQIVINRERMRANPRRLPEQIAQAIVGLVQKTESWQERIRTSDSRIVEALSPERAKRQNSGMAFRLMDSRLISGDRIGTLVENAMRAKIGDKVNDAVAKEVSKVVVETIKNSVKDFAGEAEARFLASRFGLGEAELRDYKEAEKVFKDTLVTFDSGLTSAQQTTKNINYWDNVIISAIDRLIYNKNAKPNSRAYNTFREEFREAVSNEIMEHIVSHIMSGGRAARTELEARLAGVKGIGYRGKKAEVNTSGVSYDENGNAVSTTDGSSAVDAIDDIPVKDSAYDAGLDSVVTMTRKVDMKWENARQSVVDIVKKELIAVQEIIKKDFSKAQTEQARLMKKLDKLVRDNSSAADVVEVGALINEAIRLASGGGRFGVVGARRSPKTLLTQATAARIARSRLNGKSEEPRKWLEENAKRVGVIEAERQAFVNEVLTSAYAIADKIVKNIKPTDSDIEVISLAEKHTALNELTKRVLNGFRSGYKTGSFATDAEMRAVSEAKRIQTNMVKDAKGMALSELNSMLGGDVVKDLVSLRDTFGSGDAFAVKFIDNFSNYLIANDSRFARMTKEEFEGSQVARAELARTVASWLRETSRQLAYGQQREWAMREAARLQKMPQTFGSIHMTVAKYAERLADNLDQSNVDSLLDAIDKQIDKFAGGSDAVAQSIPDYKRRIAPRLAEYWKYVKKSMRMTDEAVEKESARLNTILELNEKQLLELGGKSSNDVDKAESGLREREDAMMKLNALLRFGGMKYKNYEECRSIFDSQIATELAGQIQKHLILRDARLADDAKVRQAFIGELTAIRTARRKGDNSDELDNGTIGTNFMTFSVADLFRRMQLYLHEGTEAWNYIDTFRQDMSLGHIDKTMFISKWEGELRKAVQDIYGVNFERLIEDMMVKNPEYDKFSRTGWAIPENSKTAEIWVNGRKKTVTLAEPNDGSAPTNLPTRLSKANLLYIYAACQQADMQVNNLIYGRDAKYFKEIETIIGPEGVAMARWLTEAYSKMREVLNPISMSISGMPVLSPDEKYCPLSFVQELVSNDERRFTSSPFPSFLTRRVTHDTLRLNESQDAFRTFEDKIQDSGHYVGFAKIIDRMNTTLKHPKVQTAYAQLYGTKAKNDIYAQLADALNGGRKNSDTLLNGARNFVTAASLFGNVGSALKQLEGIGGWSIEMGVMPWLKSLIRTPMTSREMRDGIRELIDAGLFATRANEGISEAMVALMNSCDGVPAGPVSKTYRWYKRHGMDITKWVDKISSMSMAGQYYVGRKNWYIENGVPEADAKRRALADTDYAIQTTQQSGRSEFLHSAQRGGTAGKMLTQFSGPSFVRWGIECATWHRAVVMGDKGAWKKLMSRMIALHIICPSILSLAGGISGIMFRRDDQKMDDIVERTERDIISNCLTGPMSGWFIWGQIINAFAYENIMPDAKSTRSKTHFEAPVLSKLHSLQSLTSKMFKDVIKSAPWDSFSNREQKMIAEDAWRIFQMLFPVSRTAEPVKRIINED